MEIMVNGGMEDSSKRNKNFSLVKVGSATGHVNSFNSATLRKLCPSICYAVHITNIVDVAYD